MFRFAFKNMSWPYASIGFFMLLALLVPCLVLVNLQGNEVRGSGRRNEGNFMNLFGLPPPNAFTCIITIFARRICCLHSSEP